ncbi:SIR2 family protein [Curtobacterium sp. RIT-PI-V]|uniref:SIR2 family protein n=1 Tax=Curtobacterium sp. RIT-PI-V TaxID=3035296 RepID=UPI0021D82268|nr:SIR2 family protein [Curtobacterium sp. RIT-PI-V]
MDHRLQRALERKNLVFIVGTGYSAAATGGEKHATWRGLIENGIAKAESLGSKPGWSDTVRGTLTYGFDENDMDSVLSAAASVVKELKRQGEYVYPKWLQETVGELTVVHPLLGKQLRALPFPLLTTNYDELLENNDRRGTDWTNPVAMQRLLAGADSRDVGHLHGRWSNPNSVIFSDRHYDALLASDAAQALQKAASSLKSLVYVGFGAGLDDPNFSQLIGWHRSQFIPSAVDHFRLCREDELETLRVAHANDQIIPISYGTNYSELPSFLEQFTLKKGEIELSGAGIARDVVGEAQVDFAQDMKGDSIIGDALDTVEDRPVAELIRPPVLLPVPHAEYIKAKAEKNSERIERLDPAEEVTGGDVLVLAAEENTGLTTALKWLTLEAANYLVGASPIYVSFGACKKRVGPLLEAVRSEAHSRQIIQHRVDQLPPYVLGLDNYSPFVDRLSDAVLEEVRDSDALLTIIGCVQGTEEEVVDRLERMGVRTRVRYLGKLSSADIREYARLASPGNHLEVAKQVTVMLQAENLARTPFTVSLLISVLVQGGKFAANASQTSILDDYIGLLLGRGDPHEDARFGLDQTAREALLSGLAQTFVEAGVGGMSELAVQTSFANTFDKFGWDESTAEVLKSFVDRRVLRRRGNHIEFARSSFLHIFAAKRATHDRAFRETLINRPLYYSAALTDYAALYRHDDDLLRRLRALLSVEAEHERSSVFEPLALADPRIEDLAANAAEGVSSHDQPSTSDSDVPLSVEKQPDWSDEFFDRADDVDLPPFPTVHEDEVPTSIQLLRTLELLSTVLRDSDQIEDLPLKREVLHEVLERWADTMDAIHDDASFVEFIGKLIVDLELVADDGSDHDEIFTEYSRAIPAAVVMSAVGGTLASRKLTKILDQIMSDRDNPASEESIIVACFFQYSLGEPGWPGRVMTLLHDRGNIWIIRNFFLNLLAYAYSEDQVDKADADDLLELCLMIVEHGSRYQDEPERRRHRDSVRRDIDERRLKARVRAGYSKPSADSLGSAD